MQIRKQIPMETATSYCRSRLWRHKYNFRRKLECTYKPLEAYTHFSMSGTICDWDEPKLTVRNAGAGFNFKAFNNQNMSPNKSTQFLLTQNTTQYNKNGDFCFVSF